MKSKFVSGWEKKMQQFNTIVSIVDKCLITSTVINGRVSTVVFASGVGLSVGIALNRNSQLLFSYRSY